MGKGLVLVLQSMQLSVKITVLILDTLNATIKQNQSQRTSARALQ